jgi:iron complex outermembrane receptor protein
MFGSNEIRKQGKEMLIRRKLLPYLVAGVCACLGDGACGAEAKSDEKLEEVVVTATKTAKIVSEAPATVTVVTAKEIESKQVERLEEALAGTPGYYRTGILVDGVPINNAFSGGVNTSIVPIEDIKQIEVVPGPFSSLYGGAGMAGVVNVITKAPEKREVAVKGEGEATTSRAWISPSATRWQTPSASACTTGTRRATAT